MRRISIGARRTQSAWRIMPFFPVQFNTGAAHSERATRWVKRVAHRVWDYKFTKKPLKSPPLTPKFSGRPANHHFVLFLDGVYVVYMKKLASLCHEKSSEKKTLHVYQIAVMIQVQSLL